MRIADIVPGEFYALRRKKYDSMGEKVLVLDIGYYVEARGECGLIVKPSTTRTSGSRDVVVARRKTTWRTGPEYGDWQAEIISAGSIRRLWDAEVEARRIEVADERAHAKLRAEYHKALKAAENAVLKELVDRQWIPGVGTRRISYRRPSHYVSGQGYVKDPLEFTVMIELSETQIKKLVGGKTLIDTWITMEAPQC